jgi:exonuclease SbcC
MLTRLRDTVGDSDPATARAQLADGETELGRVTALADREPSMRSSLAEAAERHAALATAIEGRRLRLAELATSRDHLQGRAAALEARVSGARGDHPELRQALQALTERRDLVRAVSVEALEAASARRAHADAVTALGRAVLEAGFASADEARAALLPGEALSELERRVHDHRSALTTARAVLDDHDAWELLTTPEPDLAASEAAALAATDALHRAREAAAAVGRTLARVEDIAARLDAALAAWQPVREALALATRVSAFAEGKAADNRLQMRLSAYVLAFRLSQVVDAANTRLATMSDRRYALEHVPERGAREARGGLSLVVRDDWSGDARDPATLSGGETFVVSLALALGLADVVAHEAGGADLQTLFVDEGFGALDAETLDDVLDILDGLRENGRAVGVVSHVGEMRDRIPTQLLVAKARAGSTVQIVGG